MRKILFTLIVLLFTIAVVFAAGDQAYLGIFAETKVSKMVGMPAFELPPDMDPAMLKNIPGMDKMLSMGAPQRVLNVRLWSPSLAPKDAFAYITPPQDLKQGKKLDLELYRPEPVKGTTDGTSDSTGKPEGIDKFTIKIYWGSSDKVKAGQPKIIKFDSMTPEQQENMRKQAEKAQKADSYFYKPDWTTGYWPTKKQPGKIAADASLVGTYALTTNYTGNVSLDAPSNVNFLAPIEMTSPDFSKTPPLDKPIAFNWKPIPNLLGSYATITGMEGKDTLIIWSSSEVYNGALMGTDWGFLQMAEVAAFVESTVMMKGDRTSVTVPAGIFKNCDMAFMSMVGYGPGAALPKGQPLPRIQTKTTLSIMPLAGKGMNFEDMED